MTMALGAGQREQFLRAMGYQPLRLRAAAASSPVVSPTAAATAHAQPAAQPAAPKASAPHARPATGSDPLWIALLAAAAAGPADAERLAWEAVLTGPAFAFDGPRLRINPIALRTDAGAKRALWKTLRSLRRRHLGGTP